jgi:hypothetical protein
MLSAAFNRFLSPQSQTQRSICMENIDGRNVTIIAIPMNRTLWSAQVTDEISSITTTSESSTMEEAVLLALYELQSELSHEGISWKIL